MLILQKIILDEKESRFFNFGKHKGKAVEAVFNDDPLIILDDER